MPMDQRFSASTSERSPKPIIVDVKSMRGQAGAQVVDRHPSILRWLWNLDTRLLEIMTGVILFGSGAVLLLPGPQLIGSGFDGVLAVASETTWAVLFAIIGATKVAAVVINGRWRHSPILRIVCLCLGFAAYVMFSATLYPYRSHPAGSEITFWRFAAAAAVEFALLVRLGFLRGLIHRDA